MLGDINGDGYANDRAFVFDPASPTTDPAVADGIRSLLANGSPSARDCLSKQLGTVANRSSCEGPWYTTATGNTVSARFNDYTVEVVQKIGADSFVGGHGVLLGKTKNSSSTCAGFACSLWYIDANPQDINQVDT